MISKHLCSTNTKIVELYLFIPFASCIALTGEPKLVKSNEAFTTKRRDRPSWPLTLPQSHANRYAGKSVCKWIISGRHVECSACELIYRRGFNIVFPHVSISFSRWILLWVGERRMLCLPDRWMNTCHFTSKTPPTNGFMRSWHKHPRAWCGPYK